MATVDFSGFCPPLLDDGFNLVGIPPLLQEQVIAKVPVQFPCQ